MLEHGVLSDPSKAKSAREKISVLDLVSTAKTYLIDMPDSLISERHRGLWNSIIKAVAEDRAPWTSQFRMSGPEDAAGFLLLLMPAGCHYLLKIVLKFLMIILKNKGDGKQVCTDIPVVISLSPCVHQCH